MSASGFKRGLPLGVPFCDRPRVRRRWDSNPRTGYSPVYPISSRGRSDRFDTSPNISTPGSLGKRREHQERTTNSIRSLEATKALRRKAFVKIACHCANTISSLPRYDHFDTTPDTVLSRSAVQPTATTAIFYQMPWKFASPILPLAPTPGVELQ